MEEDASELTLGSPTAQRGPPSPQEGHWKVYGRGEGGHRGGAWVSKTCVDRQAIAAGYSAAEVKEIAKIAFHEAGRVEPVV